MQKPEKPLKFLVYPGADGTFKLYEDEGDGYGYEDGAYAATAFFWNDRMRTLEIVSREGNYPGISAADYTVEICSEHQM